MKFNDLQPTKENLCEAFKNDLIGRNEDIKRFVKLLDSLSNSYSIALDGSWGSGKTFFVKQAKLFIDAHNEHLNLIDEEDKKIFTSYDNSENVTYQPQVTVYYDAWENDNDSDPVLSLIYSIISSIDTNYKLKESDTLLNKAAAILDAFTGKNVREIASALEGKDLLDDIRKQKNLELNIKAFLNSLLEERGDRLIIFIDELDRCKPSFAVKLLERIKHYFTNDKITFVFSINLAEIQHTVKSYYGNEFDSCRYLDRFFDLRLSIPPIDMELFYTSIKFGKVQNVFSRQCVFEPVCKAVVSYYSLSLRETCRYLATCNMATHEVIFNNKSLHDYNGLLFCIIY
ncbi:MAG: KAP family NTPase, partial [Erysipelotrichaceae bacterium]|nr:KAP family NTPase [Erysipelotrichaceae bacterium]